MKQPIQWTVQELTADVQTARSIFRAERLDEPLDRWRRTYERYTFGFKKLFAQIDNSLDALTDADVISLFETCVGDYAKRKRGDPPLSKDEKKLRKEKLSDAFRYLAGPPVSADDLKVLAEVESVSVKALKAEPAGASRILETVRQALDAARFPWMSDKRKPTPEELNRAIAISAAIMTAQRVSTDRRNEGKAAQEALVHATLSGMGFQMVSPRTIENSHDGPAAQQFCGETTVGTRKADVVVRLHDQRLLLIECKVSNSGLNSVKRINNDAAIKAETWRNEFGPRNVVPMAVLSGVFKVNNLVQAQNGHLSLVWAHRITDLTDFIESTGTEV